MAQKPRVWELRNLGAKRQEIMGKLSRAVSSSKNYWVEKFFSWLTIQRRSVWVGQLRELNGLTSPRVENSWKNHDCIITNCFEIRVEMDKWWVVLLLKNNRLVVLQEKWTALKENTGVPQKRGQVLNQCYVIRCLSEVDNYKKTLSNFHVWSWMIHYYLFAFKGLHHEAILEQVFNGPTLGNWTK